MVTQMFVQIYTDSACSPMAVRFAENYQQASIRSQALQEELLDEVVSPRASVQTSPTNGLSSAKRCAVLPALTLTVPNDTPLPADPEPVPFAPASHQAKDRAATASVA